MICGLVISARSQRTRAQIGQKVLLYIKDYLLVTASAVLLVLSFPDFDLGLLAWIGLVPLLMALHGKTPPSCLVLSWVCGIIFYIGAFLWIVEIQKFKFFHHIPLLFYTGSYFGFFGLAYGFINRRLGCAPALASAPFIWTALEFIKSNMFFLSLPWGLLGHTQYRHLPLIQICNFAGAFGVSFLIVMVNAALAAIVSPFWGNAVNDKKNSSQFPSKRARISMAGAAAAFTMVVLLHGYASLAMPVTGPKVKISVVQGNIDQTKKWDRKYADRIIQIYTGLTLEACKDQPALIVWPETAVPRAINRDPMLYTRLKQIAADASANLLVGSAQQRKFKAKQDTRFEYLNSAYLIHRNPNVVTNQRYDKIRLLPFGEYLPLRNIVPWASLHVPELSGYVPGEVFKVFRLPEFRFGVTICWENIFPGLFRKFINRGAQFMINITNEAWFGLSPVPYHFVAMSVFRAIENRVYVIRCANTGISCFIDPYGRILDRVKDDQGRDIFVRGVLSGTVIPLERHTIYTRFGDWPAWFSLLGSLVFLAIAIWKKNQTLSSK